MKIRYIVLVSIAAIVSGLVVYSLQQRRIEQGRSSIEITSSERRAFLELVAQLPTQNEFFSADGVKQAIPYTRVLFAITEDDENRYASDLGIKEFDSYPLLALSADMAERSEVRAMAKKDFQRIQHPRIKLLWATLLFNKDDWTNETVEYVYAALQSEKDSKWLAGGTGPGFDDFKSRVEATFQQIKKR